MTVSPIPRLNRFAAASSPCQPLVQVLMTGARASAAAFLSTMNCEPVKNVPTAVPIRSGARQPLMVRNTLNAVFPSILPALFWNSYETAWKTKVMRISTQTQ